MKLVLVLTLLAIASSAQTSADDARINQIQVLGSHNSYKQPIDPNLRPILRERMGERLDSLEYSHLSMPQQLDKGLRALEIDVVYDPKGGVYAKPLGLQLLRDRGLPTGSPYDPAGVMMKPGFKVVHVQDIDFRANVYTFREALQVLKKWSDAHPRHVPIIITMNAKDSEISWPNAVKPLRFDAAAFDAWDAEIREILPPSKLITPDDVRGNYATLEQAALAHAWPTLGKSRGKFIFVLDEQDEERDTYIKGHPSTKGRVMFADQEEGRPEAAIRVMNEPIRDLAHIQYLVRSGYIVRTRADADTREARKGDYSRWRAALDSGAQIISTDYYQPDPDLKTGYFVHLPGQPARWDTLLLPPMRPLSALE